MKKFTIEATYMLPVFVHRTVEADSLEEAIGFVLENEDWEDQREDYESSRPTFISAAWEGEEAYPDGDDDGLPIPPEFQERQHIAATAAAEDEGGDDDQ